MRDYLQLLTEDILDGFGGWAIVLSVREKKRYERQGKKGAYSSSWNSHQNYVTPLVKWDHTVLSATRQRWPPRLHPNRAGWYSIYRPQRYPLAIFLLETTHPLCSWIGSGVRVSASFHIFSAGIISGKFHGFERRYAFITNSSLQQFGALTCVSCLKREPPPLFTCHLIGLFKLL